MRNVSLVAKWVFGKVLYAIALGVMLGMACCGDNTPAYSGCVAHSTYWIYYRTITVSDYGAPCTATYTVDRDAASFESNCVGQALKEASDELSIDASRCLAGDEVSHQ